MDLIQQGLNTFAHSTNLLVSIVQSQLDNVTLDEATVKLGQGWTQSPPGIAYYETSVLIPLSTEEVHFMEQPVFNHNFAPAWLGLFPSQLPYDCCVALFCHFLLCRVVTFFYQGVLGRGHVCMYLLLSPCLSLRGLLRDLLFALGGTLLVARGSAPLRQLEL